MAQFNTFFDETSSGKHVPRCLYLDLEPTVLDDIRVGPYCELYHPESFLAGSHDAANNFARGYCSMGSQIIVRAPSIPLTFVSCSPRRKGQGPPHMELCESRRS